MYEIAASLNEQVESHCDGPTQISRKDLFVQFGLYDSNSFQFVTGGNDADTIFRGNYVGEARWLRDCCDKQRHVAPPRGAEISQLLSRQLPSLDNRAHERSLGGAEFGGDPYADGLLRPSRGRRRPVWETVVFGS
jgi:hypothetical protein